MASTITLQSSLDWASTFLKGTQSDVGAWGAEPSLTDGNTVLTSIVGPPFRWAWNRATTTFNTVAGTQDYSVSIADWGWLEKASCTTSGTTVEIPQIKAVLGGATEQGRPESIAPQLDDGAGNITFRILPVPDAIYTISIVYQKKPSLLTGLTSTWSPVPDQYSYIYNYGFLALMLLSADDQRFPLINQKFMSHLLGANEGLSESQKNVFIEQWLNNSSQGRAHEIATERGNAARSNIQGQ